MKLKLTLATMIAGLLLSLTPASVFAQTAPCPGAKGGGYGAPPRTEQERIARQAACLEKNAGVCPNGGPKANCPAIGKGQGKGQGKGARKGQGKGLCDGTGPRSANGTCPLTASKSGSK